MRNKYETTNDIDRFIVLSASYLGLSPMRADAGYGRRQARLNDRITRTKRQAIALDKRSRLQA